MPTAGDVDGDADDWHPPGDEFFAIAVGNDLLDAGGSTNLVFNFDNTNHGAKVEHQVGFRNVRYRGIAKNGAQVFALLALVNLYLARGRLASV